MPVIVLVVQRECGAELISAFSSEVGAGSREENASKQKARASVPIQSEWKRLWRCPVQLTPI
jgi:hypothetical protein